VYYASIKIFNTLPASVAELVKEKKQFILAVRRCLVVESFYSVNECLNYQHEVKTDYCSVRKAI
jgi:hypothetical protein